MYKGTESSLQVYSCSREVGSEESWPEKFATLRKQAKWNIAVIRFARFVSDLPLSPDEHDVLEYHDILKLFEEACAQDLSEFRIVPNRVKAEADRTTKGSSKGHLQTRRPKKNPVEFVYFRGQIGRLIASLMTAISSPP
jgi:hypothetical protein